MRKVTVRGLVARRLRLALTALAIVLGVMFIAGTLVLTDTLDRTFDSLIGTAYGHVNFQIRGRAAFNNDTAAAVNGTADRKPISQSIAAAVRRVPGVAAVDGSVSGYAQIVADGNAIGSPARPSASRLTPIGSCPRCAWPLGGRREPLMTS